MPLLPCSLDPLPLKKHLPGEKFNYTEATMLCLSLMVPRTICPRPFTSLPLTWAPGPSCVLSIQHTVCTDHHYHHHHHHHHHYHFSHGSPRRPGPEPGASDARLVRAGVPASPGHGPPDAESVHSVYHADCHVEGPQERARVAHTAATAAAGLKLAAGLGAMNYPTILPSATGSGKGGLGPKAKRPGGPPGAGGHSPLRLSSPDPCEKIQHLVGEHAGYLWLTVMTVTGFR
nr:voltage-dependent T-type calcium channel subunit alpha-1H-like [Odocoileus virginianus texanus]